MTNGACFPFNLLTGMGTFRGLKNEVNDMGTSTSTRRCSQKL